jgi:hypothetical protein
MIDIQGVGPGLPIMPEELEKERLKDIKTRAGKIAFLRAMGKDVKVAEVHPGIVKAEGALKWIDEVLNREHG